MCLWGVCLCRKTLGLTGSIQYLGVERFDTLGPKEKPMSCIYVTIRNRVSIKKIFVFQVSRQPHIERLKFD